MLVVSRLMASADGGEPMACYLEAVVCSRLYQCLVVSFFEGGEHHGFCLPGE